MFNRDNGCNTLKGLHILVADDALIGRRLAERIMARRGAQITFAENGQQAIEAASVQQFDIIFMDLHMPIMDGLSAASAIRAMEYDDHHTPIIALSADECLSPQTLAHSDLDDYLIKPLQEADVTRLINRWRAEKHSADLNAYLQNAGSATTKPPQAITARKAVVPSDLLRSFINELPGQYQLLCDALKQNDVNHVKMHAHKIHGSASYCGLSALEASVGRLEKIATAESDIETIRRGAKEVNDEIRRLTVATQAFAPSC
ncbi:MAG: response regulator [Gammaproteobacteria bacterium]|nr:response regulator [Gammaproteobacteria bacterium]